MGKDKYWFKSLQFKLQQNEEEFTNPGCFGKSLAEWICEKLSSLGYDAEVIPEDWGWCVMCQRSDYHLWVGCGNILTEDILVSSLKSPPNEEEIIWHVFIKLEIPFYMLKSHVKRLFGQIDTKAPLIKLSKQLEEILNSNESITMCEEP